MKIEKSSRHSKITGNFGEYLVLYWLSKYGFECAMVDHTGIDIIARNPSTGELMGISVKTRSRNEGAEYSSLRFDKANLEKAEAACNAFGCVPYFAIVIDGADQIQAYIMTMEHLCTLSPPGKSGPNWKMTEDARNRYRSDPSIMLFGLTTSTSRWWTDGEDDNIDEATYLKAASKNPVFAFLNHPNEDIYSLEDGRPFTID